MVDIVRAVDVIVDVDGTVEQEIDKTFDQEGANIGGNF